MTSIPATALAPSISPDQLSKIIDTLAKAPTTVGEASRLLPIVNVLAMLASQKHPIGALVPSVVPTASETGTGG